MTLPCVNLAQSRSVDISRSCVLSNCGAQLFIEEQNIKYEDLRLILLDNAGAKANNG